MDVQSIEKLAPDVNAFKRGQKLSTSSKWVQINSQDSLLFATMKGSGSATYFIQIDLDSVAYKCTCPSRQFPCKHVLALLLVKANHATKIEVATDLPKWVSEWVAAREKRAPANKPAAPVTIKSPAEIREADLEKWKTATFGIRALEQWLLDIAKNGLLNLGQQNFAYYDRMARQLIDAKMPGIANRVAELQALPWHLKPTDWFESARQLLNNLFLFCKVSQNPEKLDDNFRIELQHFMGWSIKKDDILANEALETVDDEWLVLGVEIIEKDNLKTQKTHIISHNLQKIGYLLDFSFMGAPFDRYYAGGVFKAKISFYPGILNQRGQLKLKNFITSANDWEVDGYPDIASARQAFLTQKLDFPWLWDQVQILDAMTLTRKDNVWCLQDCHGVVIPFTSISEDDFLALHLVLASDNKPMQVALLQNATDTVLLGAWIDGKYIH